MTAIPSITQEWLRDYSNLLSVSFAASGRIQHNVTKGESREYQILDVLSKLLPTRASVETNIIVIDSKENQSPKFDGALVDRVLWPKIFVQDYTVAMVESVIASIEVKSSLNKAEIKDIFDKSANLRAMGVESGKIATRRPLVTAFAYECQNLNLVFFDFAISVKQNSDRSPSLICILNSGLLGLATLKNGVFVPLDEPSQYAIPVLYHAFQDALLVYLYFLSRWVTNDVGTADLFRRYSDGLFAKMSCFWFDTDFLALVCSDEKAYSLARNCFKNTATEDIESPYNLACRELGLSCNSK